MALSDKNFLMNPDVITAFRRSQELVAPFRSAATEAGLAAMGMTPFGLGMGFGPKKALHQYRKGELSAGKVRPWKWKLKKYSGEEPDYSSPTHIVEGPGGEQFQLWLEPKGKTLVAHDIFPVGASSEIPYGEISQQFKNTVGKEGLTDIMAQLKLEFPEMEKIGGFRVTGMGGSLDMPRKTTVKIPFSFEEAQTWKEINDLIENIGSAQR